MTKLPFTEFLPRSSFGGKLKQKSDIAKIAHKIRRSREDQYRNSNLNNPNPNVKESIDDSPECVRAMSMDNFGEKMELLRLSKFKLQLRSLISEVRELRERERSVTEQLHCKIQKQKQSEEEYARKLQEFEVELSSSNELRQKLERKVNYLQNDNALLENKQKELKETIQNLIQSKEHFVNAYEESTSDMKRSIQIRDRKLSVLSEKINSHLSLFDSIEKEALFVKQVVDNVQSLTAEKEDVVADLRRKLDKVSEFEKVFVEKICDLEKKLKDSEDDLKMKNKVISELEARLEAEKFSSACQTQRDELQNILSSKDVIIQNLILEKEALQLELGSLRSIIKKIQENLANVSGEDKGGFSAILECKEWNMDLTKDNRSRDLIQNGTRKCSKDAYGIGAGECTASSLSQKSDGILLLDNNNMNSCVSEASCISPNDENVKPKTTQSKYTL